MKIHNLQTGVTYEIIEDETLNGLYTLHHKNINILYHCTQVKMFTYDVKLQNTNDFNSMVLFKFENIERDFQKHNIPYIRD